MPLELVRNDITRMNTDAIVNAANAHLLRGGGVCGAIFAAAGAERLTRACQAIGGCAPGQAVLTPGFALPARYIIHTVGPVWQGGGAGEPERLTSCYQQSLRLARRHGCRSIAFPLISAGTFGYPKALAVSTAISAIRAYLTKEAELTVYLVLYDRDALAVSQELLGRVRSFIDDHYVYSHLNLSRRNRPEQFLGSSGELEDALSVQENALEPEDALPVQENAPEPTMPPVSGSPAAKPYGAVRASEKASGPKGRRSLEELLFHMDDSFSRMLLRMIDERGMTDVEVYKRANLDRKLFSKVRKESYTPSRQTAVALAIALRLNLDETRDLLSRAGYALSRSNQFDVIIEYFITEGIYDIDEINQALFYFDQKLLGA